MSSAGTHLLGVIRVDDLQSRTEAANGGAPPRCRDSPRVVRRSYAWHMAHRLLNTDVVNELLIQERLVRIGFFVHDDRYVLPLVYVWCKGRLWGTTRGGVRGEACLRIAKLSHRLDWRMGTSALN